MQNELIRDLWNEVIAKPKNKKGEFQLSPAKVREIVEKHLGKQEKPKRLKPFQVGVVYDTKFATKEKFKIEEIKYKWDKDLNKEVPYYFLGIIIGKEHLGNVPLNVDRLIQQHY